MQGEYRGDFSRDTASPNKHFRRVLMQQGRVQIDADWNEQVDILLHYLQTLTTDLIGPYGGPSGAYGFSIAATDAANSPDFVIGAGRYYIDGLLCELESAVIPILDPASNEYRPGNQVMLPGRMVSGMTLEENHYVEISSPEQATLQPQIARIRSVDPVTRMLTLDQDVSKFRPNAAIAQATTYVRPLVTYSSQPNYPLIEAARLQDNRIYLVYLDVWERHITHIEDEDPMLPGIREVALNGPDTTSRSKLVWQVKVIDALPDAKQNPIPATLSCAQIKAAWATWMNRWQSAQRGLLKAMAKTNPEDSTDPCVMAPESSYRGPENQLYRVEVHQGGTADTATFKWSRENSAVTFPIITLMPDGTSGSTVVALSHLGRDSRLSLVPGDWVEIVDDHYVLQNRAESLLQVKSVDAATREVVLDGAPTSVVGQDPTQHPILRRWDQKLQGQEGLKFSDGNNARGTALVIEGAGDTAWLPLEKGIQIQFQTHTQGIFHRYRTGDYWLIPARVATGDVEWPGRPGQPEPLPPHGIEHHYAPLGVIAVANGRVTSQMKDCRCLFDPLSCKSAYGYSTLARTAASNDMIRMMGIGGDQV